MEFSDRRCGYGDDRSLGQLCNIGGCGIPESVLHGGGDRDSDTLGFL